MAKKRGHFPRHTERRDGSTVCPVCDVDFRKSKSGEDCKCTQDVPDMSNRITWYKRGEREHGQA